MHTYDNTLQILVNFVYIYKYIMLIISGNNGSRDDYVYF